MVGYLIRKVDFAHLNRILDSYISALLKLKPDYMKIDMEIVRDIHLDIKKQKQLDEFISNGKEIGLTILAEGVEKVEEYNYLISKKVHLMQGYLFGKPEEIPIKKISLPQQP